MFSHAAVASFQHVISVVFLSITSGKSFVELNTVNYSVFVLFPNCLMHTNQTQVSVVGLDVGQ